MYSKLCIVFIGFILACYAKEESTPVPRQEKQYDPVSAALASLGSIHHPYYGPPPGSYFGPPSGQFFGPPPGTYFGPGYKPYMGPHPSAYYKPYYGPNIGSIYKPYYGPYYGGPPTGSYPSYPGYPGGYYPAGSNTDNYT